jgi:EF hand
VHFTVAEANQHKETSMKITARVLGVTISALVLAYGQVVAMAQTQPGQQAQSHSMDQEEVGTTGQGGVMCGGMKGREMMGHMGSPVVFRMMFALMDDGDGQISLQEFQAAHERIFKAMDSNKDGQVTWDEMQAFVHGRSRGSTSQQ